MAQQLHEMLQLFSSMSNEEQLDLVRQIRQRKHQERPGAKRRAQQAETKKAKPKVDKARSLLANLTPEQIKELLGNEEA